MSILLAVKAYGSSFCVSFRSTDLITGVMHQIKRLANSDLKAGSPAKPTLMTASSSSLSSTSSGSVVSESVSMEKEGASPAAVEESPSSSQM